MLEYEVNWLFITGTFKMSLLMIFFL